MKSKASVETHHQEIVMSTEVDSRRVEQSENSTRAVSAGNGDVTTQTIDVSNLFNANSASEGDFDLGKIPFTALGKLLDALPIPTLLVDSQCRLIFSNNSVKQLGPEQNRL
jgi:hypothetical protein